MDADTDCAVQLVKALETAHHDQLVATPTSIVFAVREYEAWFLAANLNEGHNRRLLTTTPVHADPDDVPNPKAEFGKNFLRPGRVYSETVDQPRFTACMDLQTALRSASFEKLVRDLRKALAP